MRTVRHRANLLLAAAAWTLYVWVTRTWNIARDPSHDLGFKAVHGLLALISIAFAVALAVVGLRMRREAARPDPPGDGASLTSTRPPVG
jgi:hypothetical protein